MKLVYILVILVALTMTGCNTTQNQEPKEQQNQQKQQDTTSPSSQEVESKGEVQLNQSETNSQKIDQDLTSEVNKEKNVAGGSIYEQDDMVLGAISLRDSDDANYANQIANKYLEKLKAKYPGKKINVQVVGKNRNLANLEYTP